MKALILAAGYATRLYPLTKDKPKALLKIGDLTILDFVVSQITKIPVIDEIVLISNKIFYDQFLNWKDSSNHDIKITVLNDNTVSNDDKLGAVGDLNFAIKTLNIDDDILVMASDNVFTFKLEDFYEFYKNNKKDCVIGKKIENKEDLKRMANITLDGHKIVDMVEKPPVPTSEYAAFASYIYNKETLPLINTYLEEGNNSDAPGNFPSWLYKKQDVYAYIIEEECYDIGTVDAYNEIQKIADKFN